MRDPSPASSGRIPGDPVASQGESLSIVKLRGNRGSCHHPKVHQISQSILEEGVFPALPRLSLRGSTPTTVARGTALWESLVGTPRGKASRKSHRSLDPRDGKRETAATAPEDTACACPLSSRGLTPLWRLQKYPKIHVSSGEESSGSSPVSRKVFRPQH